MVKRSGASRADATSSLGNRDTGKVRQLTHERILLRDDSAQRVGLLLQGSQLLLQVIEALAEIDECLRGLRAGAAQCGTAGAQDDENGG